MITETWLPVVGYEDLYIVSDLGRVKSLDRTDPIGRFKPGRILREKPHNHGYVRVTLCRNGIESTQYIHRLVAEAFIDNPNNYPEINHKDENKRNNGVCNLEWCNRQYNNTYGNAAKHKEKPVEQYARNGEFLARYDSIKQASEKSNTCSGSIGKSCRGERVFGGNYAWKYAKTVIMT